MGLGVLLCVGCVIFAGLCTPEWLFWVFVKKDVKSCLFGVVGAVLIVDPRVETGPGGVGRRQN